MHCKMLITIRLTNTSFTSHNYHFVVLVVVMMTTFKICFLRKCQAYNTVLETIVTMLHITASECTPLTMGSSHSLTNIPSFPPPQPLAATTLFSISMTSTFLDATCKWPHTVFVFVWIISLSLTPSSFIYTVTNGKISFFNGWIIFCWIHIPHFI